MPRKKKVTTEDNMQPMNVIKTKVDNPDLSLQSRITALEKRLKSLECQSRLEDIFTIKIVELEEGFAPKSNYPTDAGADLKVRPLEVDQDLLLTLDVYLNPTKHGVEIKDLPPLFINGELVDWYNLPGNQPRVSFIQNLIDHYSKTPALFLGVNSTPKANIKVGAGFKIALPDLSIVKGWTSMLLIPPRSGLSIKHGITVTNSPGVIDQTYRDEIILAITNTRNNVHIFDKGTRIAQGIIVPCMSLLTQNTLIVETLDQTERGLKGLGSSGVVL